ncbi:MAG: ABC transporter permease subunit [bacterium]
MKRVMLVAKTEMLEQRRQVSMLGVMLANYLLWNVAFLAVLVTLNASRDNPQAMALITSQALSLGICDGESALNGMVRLSNSTFGAVMFTTMPLFVAILSGYSVLNDRQNSTIPFLMLAPLSRYQLVLGKLLGAMGIPYAMHVVCVGVTTMIAGKMAVMEPFQAQFGGSPAWWVAFLLGTPASGFLVGSLGTVISGLSKDVRTSMQYTSFAIGILSLAFGHILFDRITSGVGVQLGFAIGAVLGGIVILFVGSKIISRDLA